MVRVAPIKLFYNPRTLWFDPGDLDIRKGNAVVVTTARGTEFGEATGDVFEAGEKADVKKLKTALKPVRRLATDEDVEAAYEMERRSAEALPVFKEMAAEANADMHPVSVEYLLDGDKAVFYFEAEERVDFRDLVRKLAAHFHVRIDMRQIGVRDEARMVGGLGHCGQELCCKRLGGEFCPVSIRMAKEQDLSLNPQKISGVCGRLMCCLRYEFDAYKDFKGRAQAQRHCADSRRPGEGGRSGRAARSGVAEAGRREGGEGAAGRPGDRRRCRASQPHRRRGVGARHRADDPGPGGRVDVPDVAVHRKGQAGAGRQRAAHRQRRREGPAQEPGRLC